MNLKETVALFLSLSKHSRYLNSSLFNKLQNVIYQQKAYYAHYPDLLKDIREGLDAVEANSKGEKPLEINAAYKQISWFITSIIIFNYHVWKESDTIKQNYTNFLISTIFLSHNAFIL